MKSLLKSKIINCAIICILLAGCAEGPNRDIEKRFFVNYTSLDMYVGDEVQITASPTIETFTWESEDASVASVSQAGEVLATGEGETNILVSCGDLRRTIPVKAVVKIPVTGISVSNSSLEIPEGESVVLRATILPENNNEKDNTLIWQSSDLSVVTVSGGMVTAVGRGSAVITVSMRSNPSMKTEIPISVYQIINVVRNKPVTHSDLTAGYPGQNAVNGIMNDDNRWVSDASTSAHWIIIDLQGFFTISSFQMWRHFAPAGPDDKMRMFMLQAWIDEEWVTVVEEENADQDPRYYSDFEPVTTDKIRLYIPPYTNNRVRLYEIEVYSKIVN